MFPRVNVLKDCDEITKKNKQQRKNESRNVSGNNGTFVGKQFMLLIKFIILFVKLISRLFLCLLLVKLF